jgi:hypothetical protein
MARTSGGTYAGAMTVRKFPFAYNTPALDTGAALYTPTAGDIMYDAWIEVDTAWDGATPFGDIWILPSGSVGFYNSTKSTEAVNMLVGEVGQSQGITGNCVNGSATTYNAINGDVAILPAKFVSTDPVCVIVSQDGTVTAQASVLAAGAPPVQPLVVVTGVNDTFTFTPGGGGGAPEVFTVAAGSYANIAAITAAMGAAIGALHGEAFSTLVTPSVSGASILLTMIVDSGIAGNGDTITPGATDVSAGLGLANPTTFAGGTGGDPGSSAGAGILYLVTVRST